MTEGSCCSLSEEAKVCFIVSTKDLYDLNKLISSCLFLALLTDASIYLGLFLVTLSFLLQKKTTSIVMN